jgi:hypothetical protein
MKTFHVLGLAPSIQDYKQTTVETIGVNDIYRHYPVDHLLIMDHIDTFTPERLEIIKNSKPKKTYSNFDEWSFMPNFFQIGLNPTPGSCAYLGYISVLPRHVDSTFTAVALAYCLGAKEIIMYGVDFKEHSSLMAYEEQILLCYANMLAALRKRGIKLFIASGKSLLAQVLPVHEKED